MESFTIKDPVFGEYKITEPVLIELINTKAMQRLSQINQLGPPKELYYGMEYSRLEHSLGVLIILDMYSKDIKEKIAGLLHDVSHMAFSHIYDFVVEKKEECHQDDIFFDFIKNDYEITAILKKYNFDINDFSDVCNYHLLKKKYPDIYADNLDSGIREFYYFYPTQNFVNNTLHNLTVVNNEFVFKNKIGAKEFANAYLWVYSNNWNSPKNIEKQWLFGQTLKRAIEVGLITHDDFYKDDEYIKEKLYSSSDNTIIKNIEMLKNNTMPINNRYKKLRYVDPKYLDENGNIVRLKETDEEYNKQLEEKVSAHPSYK